MIPKLGSEVIYHFAHIPNEHRVCAAAGESPEHLRAKLLLYRLFTAAGYDVALEAGHRFHRRMDLRVSSATRWCAIEIQASRIAVSEMRRRIASDRRAGAFDTVWVWSNRWRPPDKPDDLEPADLVQVPDDVRYAWNSTWNAQPMLRFGAPWLASFSRAFSPEGRLLRHMFAVRYFPASGRLVVARDRYQRPSVRFAVEHDGGPAAPLLETIDDDWVAANCTGIAARYPVIARGAPAPRGACDDLDRADGLLRRELNAQVTDAHPAEQIGAWNNGAYAAAEHDRDYLAARERIRSARAAEQLEWQ